MFSFNFFKQEPPDLQALTTQGNKIMNILQDLSAKVAANTTVTESAIALITGLKIKLDDAIASEDPAKLQALSDSLDAETAKLAAAIAANTPAAPAADPAVDTTAAPVTGEASGEASATTDASAAQ
jgi:hypothetical protein